MGDSGETIVAYCGLVCSKCGAYIKGRCKGCFSDKPMNKGCKIKACAKHRRFETCADCHQFNDLAECKKLNNFISKVFKLIFKSDRLGNLRKIRVRGLEEFKKMNK